MSKPASYAETPQEIRDGVEQLIRTYGSDPALLAGVFVAATTASILAAKAEERARVRDAVVGHIMTVVESLMEGRMTDAGLTKKDHIEMQAQIEALDVVADEIQSLQFHVSSVRKSENQEA